MVKNNKHLYYGFLSFTILFALISIVNILLFVVGCVYYPRIVIPYILIPYYTYVLFIGNEELYDGLRWNQFSQYFPLFIYMRKFLDLQILVPDDVKEAFIQLQEQQQQKQNNHSIEAAAAETSNDDNNNKKKNHHSNKEEEQQEEITYEQQQQYIFAVFPHGTHADYRVLMDGLLDDNVIPNLGESKNSKNNDNGDDNNIRTLAASVLFRIPIVREICLFTGGVDARRSVAIKLLTTGGGGDDGTYSHHDNKHKQHHSTEQQQHTKQRKWKRQRKRRSILVLPGGELEQIRTQYQQEKVYLKNRKGFIKLALRYNIPVVPVYVFGVNDYYITYSFADNIRLWLVKKFGIAIPPFVMGYYNTWWCPKPIKTTIVFDKPIQFQRQQQQQQQEQKKNDDDNNNNSNNNISEDVSTTTTTTIITEEELDIAHEQFCNALIALFERHKNQLGYGHRKLQIE